MKTSSLPRTSKPAGRSERTARKVRFLCPSDACSAGESRQTSQGLASNPQNSPEKKPNSRSALPPIRFKPFAVVAEPTNYGELAGAIGALVAEKQAAYGDSFGKSGAVLRILYPNGISLEQLDDALTIVRVLDKLFRIATDREALGENPWKDIVGYGLLAVARAKR